MRRSHLIVVGLVALGLVAAACGGGAQPTKAPVSPEERGKQLANAQGCLGCHSTDGSPLVGPTWKGAYGGSVELADGSRVTADDAYLTESILDPNTKIHKGFPAGTMPSFQGILSPDDIQALIAYMKTLR
ncbi:MAG: c-type cytochrome [Chloroflexi bacterium]|nr:c-type cytochrome [Chloroflexota bacterium]